MSKLTYALHRITFIAQNDLGAGIGKRAAFYRRETRRWAAWIITHND